MADVNGVTASAAQLAGRAYGASRAPGARAGQANSGQPARAGQHVDRVVVSGDAQVAYAALTAMRAAPEIRVEHVAALRRAIQDGTFRVDPERIALKMLERTGA